MTAHNHDQPQDAHSPGSRYEALVATLATTNAALRDLASAVADLQRSLTAPSPGPAVLPVT
jgi:hypothetical protein